MDDNTGTLTTTERYPTQHAMLVIWGHFAQTIGLVEALAKVRIAQKAVVRRPQEKIAELLVGLLAGIEYLTDLSEGAAPLCKDIEVATAWQLSAMADASGVSRTLSACDDETGLALGTMLNRVAQPFLLRAVSDLRQRNEPLVLDADLTGRPVSSTSRTYPGAAFGYMDGEIRQVFAMKKITHDDPNLLATLHRYEVSARRAYHKALQTLLQLQALRKSEDRAPEPSPKPSNPSGPQLVTKLQNEPTAPTQSRRDKEQN
jgi:hypothetical protein